MMLLTMSMINLYPPQKTSRFLEIDPGFEAFKQYGFRGLPINFWVHYQSDSYSSRESAPIPGMKGGNWKNQLELVIGDFKNGDGVMRAE